MRGVIYREWMLLSGSPASFWHGILDPILYLVFFLAGIGQLAGGRSYIIFAFPGVLALMSLAVGQSAGVPVFFDRFTGERETLFSLPVPRVFFLVGRLMTALVRMWSQAVVAVGLGLLLYPALRSIGWLSFMLLVMGSGAVAVIWSCIAIWVAASVKNQAQFNLAINLLVTPVLMTSSAFYPLENLPLWLRWIGRLNPMSYFITGLRSAIGLGAAGWGTLLVVAATGIIAYIGAQRSFTSLQP